MNPILALSTPISTLAPSGSSSGMKLASAPEPGKALSDEQIDQLGLALGLQPDQMDLATRSVLQQWWLSGEPLPPELADGLQTGGDLPALPVWLEGRVGLADSPESKSKVLKGPVGQSALPAAASTGSGGDLQPKNLIASVDFKGAFNAEMETDLNLTAFAKNEIKSAMPAVNQVLNGIDALVTSHANATLENLQAVASQAKQALPPALTQNLLAMPIPQKVGDAAWGQAMADRLIWMVRGDQQNAELKITPPNLGPMEVKLTINNDQASVSFVSHHAQVRDAIEAALPRLREMMAQQSLDLVDVNVGDGRAREDAAGQSGESDQTARGAYGHGDETDDLAPVAQQTQTIQTGLGLVDLFA